MVTSWLGFCSLGVCPLLEAHIGLLLMCLSIWLTHAIAETFFPSFLHFLLILGTQPLHIMLQVQPGSSPSVLGMFCSIHILKGGLLQSWESCPMHSTWCMVYGAWCSRIWGCSSPPSPNRTEQQSPWSPPSLGEATRWFQ